MMLTSFVCLVVTTMACHPAPLSPREAPPVTVDIASAKEPAATRLSAMGCSVQLPGSWKRVDGNASTNESWSAEAVNGTEALSVLPMAWHVREPQAELRMGLDDILNLRREADVEQRGPRAVLSQPELLDDPNSPAKLYITFDPEARVVFATMVRATPSLACVLFLTREATSSDGFLQYAKSVLRTVVVER
ncbi:hypothetical protein [Sorangium sp. So ce887]|uniref:hypothetical protein n=1 Tax=Sorangium sp. So ce887 TaxID=3133324 RepID=UPI003F62F81A